MNKLFQQPNINATPLIIEATKSYYLDHQHDKQKGWIGLIYLDIINFHRFEADKINLLQVINSFKFSLMQSIHQVITPENLIDIQSFWVEDFLILFHIKDKPSYDQLSRMAFCLGRLVKTELNWELMSNWGIKVDLRTGHALIEPGPEPIEMRLGKAIKRAFIISQQQSVLEELQRTEELKDIIKNRHLETFFQPLIHLETGHIMGLEALTRGPAGSSLASPAVLFPLAQQTGLLYKLEKTTRELALTSLTHLPKDYKLFINTSPQVINDPEFVPGQTKKLIKSLGLSPRNIVFEITERTSIKDFESFRQTLEHYRNQGFLIAVDDAGAGYSSLQAIAELSPDFIKIDMSLIRAIDKSPIKKALVETFVLFSQKIHSKVIAEGIETQEELQTLSQLGVPYGQGFYLGKPLPTF